MDEPNEPKEEVESQAIALRENTLPEALERVEITEFDVDEADRLYEEYAAAYKRSRSHLDRVRRDAYYYLRHGHGLINLNRALSAGGLGQDHLPRLAIGVAAYELCYYRHFAKGAGQYDWRFPLTMPHHAGYEGLLNRLVFHVPEGTFPSLTDRPGRRVYFAPVPQAPPEIRPADYTSCHVLWEVRKWERAADFAQAKSAADPLLLRQIHHPIYSVVGRWDVSPVEALIVEGMIGGRR